MAATDPSLPHPRRAFGERLALRPLLFDGAMGTLLFSRGVPQQASLDQLVLTRPEIVAAVHREYIAAGADAIETCTFGANAVRLEPFGLGGDASRISRRGAQLAREARDVAGRDVLVAGSVGPLSSAMRAPLQMTAGRVAAVFREQVEGLLEGGVDLLVLETFGLLEELLQGLDVVRSLCDLPVVAEMTFGEELRSLDGTTPEEAARALAAAGADAVGVNCGAGPVVCLDALSAMVSPTGAPLSIMPNAGFSQRVEGRFVYAADPSYFSEMAPRFVAAGAAIVGGCCGTTPAHVAAMRAALDAAIAGAPAPAVQEAEAGAPDDHAPPRVSAPAAPAAAAGARAAEREYPAAGASGLARALADHRFVVSVEIDPPRSVLIERTLDAARLLRDAGADLVNVSDSAMARVRMGAMAVAFAIQDRVGLECLVHLTTRDRNLMALESELLGAHALGIRNVLALTGDPPRVGAYPTGTGVWDVDSIGLIGIIARLNRGEDASGTPIGAPAHFTIACALDPTAEDLDHELARLEQKLEAGAHVVLTQPVYDRAQWDRLAERIARRWRSGRLPVPVLAGLLPLHSARHAEFLHHEVPGITIPDEVRAVMRAAGDRGAELGLELALELLAELRGSADGTYLMPSFGRYEMAAELVRRIRQLEPPSGAGSGPVA
jgi:methionine synthase I (cobalamin-dependent)/5,10-methylenetetrahydrofolate reductase